GAKKNKYTPRKKKSGGETPPTGSSEGSLRGRSKKFLYKYIKKQTDSKWKDNYFPYKYNDIRRIIGLAKQIFQEEPTLVECGAPAVVVGDLHGQYQDLLRVFNFFGVKRRKEGGIKPGWLTQKYVFLGDYIDRGKQSIEVMTVCFSLKVVFPNCFFLLRGNHETKAINKQYGFMQELEERFPKDQADKLFSEFNEAFTYMPLACIIGNSILCMHGGISPKLSSLQDILDIPKPLVDPNANELACDLMWSDPMIGLKGYKENAVRGVSVHFGEDALEEVMDKLNLHMVVRGHQMMMNGFNFFHSHKLVTIFSAASYYPERANRGAVLFVSKEFRVGFKILVPSKGGAGKKVFRGDHEISNDYDDGHVKKVDEDIK
ncbi:hypothetical protein PFISCL1PPCAC_9719, partial [Pristionchus fissidentatus]